MTTYKVPPFSGPDHAINAANLGGEGTLPCAICGMPVYAKTHKHWASVYVDADNQPTWTETSDSMGKWPVCNYCHVKKGTP